MRTITALLLTFLLAANAQQQAPQEPITTFQSSSQLVVEIVTVHDKDGKSIEGLTARDFTVTENGAPQTITFAEFQKLAETAETPEPQFAARPVTPSAPAVTQTQIAPEKPGDIRYRN